MTDWSVGSHLGRIARTLDALLARKPEPTMVVNVFVTGNDNPEEIAASVVRALEKRAATAPIARRV